MVLLVFAAMYHRNYLVLFSPKFHIMGWIGVRKSADPRYFFFFFLAQIRRSAVIFVHYVKNFISYSILLKQSVDACFCHLVFLEKEK